MARKKSTFSRRRVSALFLVVFTLLFLPVPPAAAQQPGDPGTPAREVTQPWITVAPPTVAEEDPRNEALALVIADNLELTLRLIGEYVVRPRPTERTAPTDAASAAAYAAREEVDYVVFGEVSDRADGSTEFSLFVYSRETGTVTLERRAVAETIFDTFDVADELAAEVLGAFTGQRIAYGRVELANLGEAGAEYQVRVDGTVVGRKLTALERVLVGERLVEVEVLSGPQAGEVVASRRFLVEEGARERLEFTALAPLPVPEPEELLVEVPEEPEEELEPDPGIAVAPEPVPEPDPEIPLELRAYRWGRNDPGRQWTASLAYQLHVETRPDWEQSLPLMGMRGRFDWGARHSLLLGYEGTELDAANYSNNSRFFSESDVGEPVTFEPGPLQRAYLGYGLRSRPLGPITVIPSIRAGIERQYYLAYAGDRGGSGDISDLIDPDYEYSRPFWAGSLGLDLALELTLRRFLIYGSVGALGVVPFNPDYDEIILGRDTETGEAIPFRAVGSIDAEFGWYAGLGIGYAFGGDEHEVDRASVEPRPFRSFAGALSRNWGAAFGLDVGFAWAAGSDHVNELLWPFPGLAFEIAHRSGYLGAVSFAVVAGVHPVTVLWAPEEEPTETASERGTQIMDFLALYAGFGRRLRIGESWFLKPSYRVGISELWTKTQGDLVESGGYNDELVLHGPSLTLEHTLPGTTATVYAAGHVTMIAPLGETDYVTGVEGRQGTFLAANAHAEGYHHAGLDVGVLFRLAGMPPRLLSEDARGEWRGYSGQSTGGPVTSGTADDAEAPGFFRRWVIPRLAIGTGVEWHGQSYGDSLAGFVAAFPITLRFPFGLEIAAQGAIPFAGDGGVQGDREEMGFATGDPESPDVRATGFSRVTRLFSLEVGYRFFSRRRLSVRPGVRATWMDHELWGIRNELADGSVIEAGDERFARGEIGLFAGPAVDVLFRLSDRVSLTAGAGVIVRALEGSVVVNPAFSPELEYRRPSNFTFLGIGAALEL
ncbi:MAG: hypothetical protein EA427_17315 [Spirochaetaceae bacterium]|nr:MAG: hypothetical protein EA427_17315 [Spirochaetaceae bacterium]